MSRSLFLAFLLLLSLAVPGTSLADEARLKLGDDGLVQVDIWVDASPEVVHAVLAGPFERGELTEEVRSARVISRNGACRTLVIDAEIGPLDLSYQVQRCDSKEGMVETLDSSEMMTDHWARWSIRPENGGTHVRLQMKSELDIPVPSSLQQSELGKSARTTVANLAEAATRRKG